MANIWIPAACPIDVLIEQMDYLLAHAQAGCTIEGCRECERLRMVGIFLNSPFSETDHPVPHTIKPKAYDTPAGRWVVGNGGGTKDKSDG